MTDNTSSEFSSFTCHVSYETLKKCGGAMREYALHPMSLLIEGTVKVPPGGTLTPAHLRCALPSCGKELKNENLPVLNLAVLKSAPGVASVTCFYCSGECEEKLVQLITSQMSKSMTISHVVENQKPRILSKTCSSCKSAGNLARCAGCLSVYYCSAKCQKSDWKDHKVTCKFIQGTPEKNPADQKAVGQNKAIKCK